MITLYPHIRQKIEARFGSPIRYPKDCEALSASIYRACNERLSVTTLKRFFGFAKSVEKPRLYTLDVLAAYVGYKDWSSLMAERTAEKAEHESTFIPAAGGRENDVYLLRHQLLHSLATADIDIPAVEKLCRQFGKQPETHLSLSRSSILQAVLRTFSF